MKNTRKTKLTALFLVLITLLSALFIPTSAAEMDTSENVGVEEIMPMAANSTFNWTYSHHYIHKDNDLNRDIHSVFYPEVYDALSSLDRSNATISYPAKDGGMIYVFDYPGAGYQGGFLGTGETLNHIRVVVNICGNVKTAYPV